MHVRGPAIAILLSACATSPDVQTTLDPGADPGRYRTFTFVQGDPKATGAITDDARIRAALPPDV